jgi:hypothetical protein
MRAALVIAVAAAVLAIAGCGLNVSSPDLFVLTRTRQGETLTLLVNDAGTIRCNGGPTKSLADRVLLQARDLATSLDNDAKHGLRIAAPANSIYQYKIKLQDGTITFPDTAAAGHKELAQAELFAVQAAQGPCGQAPA